MKSIFHGKGKRKALVMRTTTSLLLLAFFLVNANLCLQLLTISGSGERYDSHGLFGTSANDHAPDLLLGSAIWDGNEQETLYNFKVIYQDQDNDAPSYVRANVNGISRPMGPVNETDVDYSDGRTYEVMVRVTPGICVFYFTCSDGNFTCTTNQTAIVVDEPSSDSGPSPLEIYLVVIIVIGVALIVLVVGFMAYKRRFIQKAKITVVNPTPRHPFSPGEFKEFASRIDSGLENGHAAAMQQPTQDEYITPVDTMASFSAPELGLLPPPGATVLPTQQDIPPPPVLPSNTVDDSTGIRNISTIDDTSGQENAGNAIINADNLDASTSNPPERLQEDPETENLENQQDELTGGDMELSQDGVPSDSGNAGMVMNEAPDLDGGEQDDTSLNEPVGTGGTMENERTLVPTRAVGPIEPRAEAEIRKKMKIYKYVCKNCKIKTIVKNPDPSYIYLCPNCEKELTLLARCKNCGSSIALKSQDVLSSSEGGFECPICHENVIP